MYYQHETDETLVMLTLAGEQTAYEILVTRYQKAVIASAIAVTKNQFIAEDAAQDAFVTAWMKLNTLQDHAKYGPWVCRIAKNCARNMIGRYRSFLPLETVENLDIGDDSQNPAELYALSEEKVEIGKSVDRLPEKVRQIIHLHYFEGLSIAEIADHMRISEGTVKWQLHDGRKRIRKELCAMNEKYNDTLVQRVMKKVEELKLWQVKNDKSGFEKVYKEVLREVEELPECREKQHALADVLMRGWWWLPGKKNDALFARIADAAIEGKNEEVMSFIVAREDSNVSGRGAKIEFIRDKQIPRLEKAGFVKTLGREWFWLGFNLFRKERPEEGHAAYDNVERILGCGDAYHALVPYARKMEERLATHYQDATMESYRIAGRTNELRILNGSPRYWAEEGFGQGWLDSFDLQCSHIFRNASICDGGFFADIGLGETHIGTDGTILTYLSDDETVDTTAGRFEGCQVWETRRWTNTEKIVCRTYYKEGVGIVKQEHSTDGATAVRMLRAYTIKGGSGLLPFAVGNTWEYVSEASPETIAFELTITVPFADDERVLLSCWENVERLGYDENSWLDTVQQIANEYCYSDSKGSSYLRDVYSVIDRAERLAKTPMEKAYTKAAASVARRILDTDTEFNPNYTATGHWNFFNRSYLRKKCDTLTVTDYNSRWSFEWKHAGPLGIEGWPLLYNDVYDILQDATNCLWSDEWRIGAAPIVEYTKWSRDVRTEITCEDGGTITTKAGTFENCFKLCLDIGGMTDGWAYRGGKKVYYFAEGVGIVRTEGEYCNGAKTGIYELTAYEGTGDGFMPAEDGMVRRYDAIGLTDGFVGSVVYTYVADEDGDIVLFADQTGIRQVPPPITQYSSIHGEVLEQQLWNDEKWEETHALHAANNVNLLLHYLTRHSWNRHNAERSAGIFRFNQRLIRQLGNGEDIPPAWIGLYAWCALNEAIALFDMKENEEGYACLETAVTYYERWNALADEVELSVGDPLVFGDVRYQKGKETLLYPDGKREPIRYGAYKIDPQPDLMYNALTASSRWEGFDAVRTEERFLAYVERAKKLAGKES